MSPSQKKKINRVLLLQVISPFISGFLTAMIVFTEPEGMMLIGLAGMVGLWMISSIASYKAIKGLLFGR
ncbi:MAG: hypothetical protein U9P71_09885 [Campylobacterota bacterium]|nr:hypothetical protein [Campylobacterota bacterium]